MLLSLIQWIQINRAIRLKGRLTKANKIMPMRTVFQMQTLKNPADIEPNAEAFKAWMSKAEKMIDSTMKNAMEQLKEVGAAMARGKAFVGGTAGRNMNNAGNRKEYVIRFRVRDGQIKSGKRFGVSAAQVIYEATNKPAIVKLLSCRP